MTFAALMMYAIIAIQIGFTHNYPLCEGICSTPYHCNSTNHGLSWMTLLINVIDGDFYIEYKMNKRVEGREKNVTHLLWIPQLATVDL